MPSISEKTGTTSNINPGIHVEPHGDMAKGQSPLTHEQTKPSVTPLATSTAWAYSKPISKVKPTGSKKQNSSNSFSVLVDQTDDNKENLLPKRHRKPTPKVAEALQAEVEALSRKKKG